MVAPLLVLGLIGLFLMQGKGAPKQELVLIPYKGETLNTSPANIRAGDKSVLLEWAKAQHFVPLPDKSMDPEMDAVLRAFISNAADARRLHAVPALFATMQDNPMLAVVVYDPPINGVFSQLLVQPP